MLDSPDSLSSTTLSSRYDDTVWLFSLRVIYSRTAIFSLRQKYNVPVQMSTHEGVNEYIARFVQSVQPLIAKVGKNLLGVFLNVVLLRKKK